MHDVINWAVNIIVKKHYVRGQCRKKTESGADNIVDQYIAVDWPLRNTKCNVIPIIQILSQKDMRWYTFWNPDPYIKSFRILE